MRDILPIVGMRVAVSLRAGQVYKHHGSKGETLMQNINESQVVVV